VDRAGFDAGPYQVLGVWLDDWISSELFISVMGKN